MNAAVVQREGRRPGLWSLAAFGLSVAGVATTVALIAAAERVEGVFWPLVVAPVVISLAPVVAPSRAVRIGAAVLLALWCALTAFTIGLVFLPAFVAQIGAAIRERT